MNLDDYEQKSFSTYQAFAKTVRFILENAILAAENLPRPQSIQCRAKGMESLRRRLVEEGKMDTQTLELDRRDLAGARLIFYTNNDVVRFLNSPLIHENFKVEDDSTKIHHPRPENKEAQYRAHHYTVRLREDRVRLPEYAKFKDLRCEIQVQTILNHAWSETFHDIIYKDKVGDGYGRRAMEGITLRSRRIVEKYLIPAGFEIQKAQQEYERVLQGKELFDRDIANLLDDAQNNNQRYQILSGLKDYAIPYYDDLSAAYQELKGPLLRAVKAARATPPAPIETTYGSMEGFKPDAVTKLVVEIVASLRFADIIGTLQLLIDIYRDEPGDLIRQQIVNTVKNMSEYNIDAYNQVGPMLQMVLVDHLASLTDAEVDSIRPIALTVWTEAIQSDITGSKWKGDSVVLSTGAVPASDQLSEVRDKAIKGLFAAYDRSTDDPQRRAVLSGLYSATRTPNQAHYSNELLATTLKDATRIVAFVTERSEAISYELLQHLEHRFFYDYLRANPLSKDPENQFGCQSEAQALMTAIFKFRDTINADDLFVRYKVLVGFESIYPDHWTDEEFDFNGADEYRRTEADHYIDEIDATNESYWFNLIARCAETKSSDLATFPVFGNFISKLAERKPEVADRFLAEASDDLRNFLPGFLNGLALSGRPDIYQRILATELTSARNLSGVVRHLRFSEVKQPEFVAQLLKCAIDKSDQRAIIDCLLLVLEHCGTEKVSDADTLVRDALTFLNDRKDPSWVSEAWFLEKSTKFYEDLSPERTAQLLQNLSYIRQIDYQVERVLLPLAERQPAAVWDYLGARLVKQTKGEDEKQHFEAVPFRFHGLEKALSKNSQLAVNKGLSWFVRNPELFQFRGGRLLSNAFPNCTTEFASALVELVESGGDTEAEFVLAILHNYQGKVSTHVVLKEIVSRFPEDEHKLSGVRSSINSTGAVWGELGLAEAWQAKKETLTEWLTDERPTVKTFAEKHIAQLDLMIMSERRSAEARKEMRMRSYDEEVEKSGDDIANDGER
ncbi:MAG: RelA/SpoT domain-containing protein [Nitrospira sp.]|nr:RelA/SpoT domain-containing protein [Nitrospira sp.]